MKQRTIITRLILVIMCYASVAVGQGRNALADSLISKLKTYTSNHISEKAYLQFDKPFYTTGDTIYFKAYVTAGDRHELSGISGVLNVDLINTANKVDQFIKLQLQNGLAWGDFTLPDSLPKGNYRIRAYTNWMRNDGDAAFFEQIIPVASVTDNKIAESSLPRRVANGKPDIQFFPEGGSLVAGIRTKIAFKAIGPNGLAMDAKGVVTDSEEKEVCSFASGHLGMGYFYIEPSENKTYKAKVTFANGQGTTIDLPKAGTQGITLSVNNDSIPQALVKIEASKAYLQENRGKDYTVIIYSGGIATAVTCKLDQEITLHILKRRLHTGIAGITLFAPTGEPLCERLIFVQNYDQLAIGVSADKDIYAKREKVSLTLSALNRRGDPAEGHFSVSVVDESKVANDDGKENNILTNLLLTSDLKGYVEQPAYYFNDTSAVALQNLDVLMLTQGYRRFEWKQVLADNDKPLAYQPEKGMEINGQVKNLLGKPIAQGSINLMTMKAGQILTATTDENGMFHFQNLTFSDTTHFMLNATNSKGKNTTKIIYFTDKPLAVSQVMQPGSKIFEDNAMAALVENARKQRIDEINYGGLNGKLLKEVNIKDKKINNDYRTQSLAGPGNADQVMHADEIERVQGQLSTSLLGRLRNVRFVNGVPVLTKYAAFRGGPMLVVVDGAEMPAGYEIDFITVNQVESIEVLSGANSAIYGMGAGNGVLIITTKQGGGLDPRDIASIGVLPVMPKGFYKAREFYQPKYDNPALAQKQHDYRSTICWQPEIVTGKDGNASLDYFNADGTGTYKVVVEGIDNNGNIGRMVYRYKVE